MAFWVFLAFYVLCAAITWFAYVRRPTVSTTKAPKTTPAEVEETVTTG
jgi:NNP family nitrate/nitrite transporter-like MFS transporter